MIHFIEQIIILYLELLSIIFFENAYQNLTIKQVNKRLIFTIPLILLNSYFFLLISSGLYRFLILNSLAFLCFWLIYRRTFVDTLFLLFFSYLSLMLVELFLIPILLLIPLKPNSFLFCTIGNAIMAVTSFFICKRIPLWKLYERFQQLKWFTKFSTYNIFLLCMFGLLTYKLNPDNITKSLLDVSLALFLLICVNAELLISHFHEQKNQKQLQAYEEYLPIIQELISQVREKQHAHNNDIQAMQMLPLSYKDYDSLTSALMEYTTYLSNDNISYELLKLNLNVVSGFLIRKQSQAIAANKQLEITIKTYEIKTNVPEYQLIDIIGILTDNALEATPLKKTAFLTLDSLNNQMIIQTKNIGLPLTEDLKNKMFSKGYTTKTEETPFHGIGLHKLKKLVNTYQGSIILFNEEYENETYLCFKIIV